MMNAYFRDRVVVMSATTDKWNSREFKERTSKARIEYGTEMVRDYKGAQVVSSAKVLMPIQNLKQNDRLRFDDQEHPILSVGQKKHFSKVYMVVRVK